MRDLEIIILNRWAEPGREPDPRVEVRLAVDVDTPSNFYAGFTENLSECGVFVATEATLTIGSRVDLWISLPHKEPIRARGTVRWQRRNAESHETAPGLGIRFDRLSSEDTDHIHQFAQARAPIFFDDEPLESAQRTTLRP